MITIEKILDELSMFNEYAEINLKDLSENKLIDLFNEHCEKYSEEFEIIDIWQTPDIYNREFATETPDGWQLVGDLYKKPEREIRNLELINGKSIKISYDHKFETQEGWVFTKDLEKSNKILTKNGFVEIESNEIEGIEEVYDWEILHKNHRYWSNGMSSHNTGKSFFCLNVAREAQKVGYNVIYCDTEGAIDKTTAKNFGIDQSKMRYQPIQTVSQFQTFVTNLLDIVKKAKEEKGESPKILLILDSLGMLTTEKEIADAIKGHNAADMGAKAKELRKLFRVITLDLTAAKIPLIATNHVYAGGGYMPTKESSGGDGPIFAMSVVSFLSKAQLKDGSGTKTGIIVTSNLKKSRFTVPEAVKFHISFAHGMNPFVGLQDYVSWESCGIERGKFEEVKNGDGKKEIVFKPNASSTRWGVKHLGKTVASTELFTEKVFTMEVLKMLDEKIIKPKFRLPDISDTSDLEALISMDERTEEDENKSE